MTSGRVPRAGPDRVVAYVHGAAGDAGFWEACRAVAERASARGDEVAAERRLRRAGAGGLDRPALRAHAPHYLAMPLARWAPGLAGLLRRDGAPGGGLRIPWPRALRMVAESRGAEVRRAGGHRRDAWVLPLVTRGGGCVAALHVRAPSTDSRGEWLAARAEVLAARAGPPLDGGAAGLVRLAARDVHAAILLTLDRAVVDAVSPALLARPRPKSEELPGRVGSAPQLLAVFRTSPDDRERREHRAKRGIPGSPPTPRRRHRRGRSAGGEAFASFQRSPTPEPPPEPPKCVLS